MGIRIYLFFLLIFLSVHSLGANKSKKSLVDSYLAQTSDCRLLDFYLYFCGSTAHEERVMGWIENVRETAIGRETLAAIQSSGHRLLIMHDVHSVGTAGKTLAPLSFDLSNGVGRECVIQMHLDMPDTGTHIVTSVDSGLILFTAKVNFFHELSHARHKMSGTWLAVDSEGQAVADENIYRRESAEIEGVIDVPLRDLKFVDGDQRVWFPL